MNPFDYGLCDQTVTLYGIREGALIRQVVQGCHFAPETVQQTEFHGKSRLKKFLLIIPGDGDVRPGDRVYDGIGPESTQWDSFLPDLLAPVYEIGYVQPCCWEGEVCHLQAGQR